jgi:hypothetical protein
MSLLTEYSETRRSLNQKKHALNGNILGHLYNVLSIDSCTCKLVSSPIGENEKYKSMLIKADEIIGADTHKLISLDLYNSISINEKNKIYLSNNFWYSIDIGNCKITFVDDLNKLSFKTDLYNVIKFPTLKSSGKIVYKNKIVQLNYILLLNGEYSNIEHFNLQIKKSNLSLNSLYKTQSVPLINERSLTRIGLPSIYKRELFNFLDKQVGLVVTQKIWEYLDHQYETCMKIPLKTLNLICSIHEEEFIPKWEPKMFENQKEIIHEGSNKYLFHQVEMFPFSQCYLHTIVNKTDTRYGFKVYSRQKILDLCAVPINGHMFTEFDFKDLYGKTLLAIKTDSIITMGIEEDLIRLSILNETTHCTDEEILCRFLCKAKINEIPYNVKKLNFRHPVITNNTKYLSLIKICKFQNVKKYNKTFHKVLLGYIELIKNNRKYIKEAMPIEKVFTTLLRREKACVMQNPSYWIKRKDVMLKINKPYSIKVYKEMDEIDKLCKSISLGIKVKVYNDELANSRLEVINNCIKRISHKPTVNHFESKKVFFVIANTKVISKRVSDAVVISLSVSEKCMMSRNTDSQGVSVMLKDNIKPLVFSTNRNCYNTGLYKRRRFIKDLDRVYTDTTYTFEI